MLPQDSFQEGDPVDCFLRIQVGSKDHYKLGAFLMVLLSIWISKDQKHLDLDMVIAFREFKGRV